MSPCKVHVKPITKIHIKKKKEHFNSIQPIPSINQSIISLLYFCPRFQWLSSNLDDSKDDFVITELAEEGGGEVKGINDELRWQDWCRTRIGLNWGDE